MSSPLRSLDLPLCLFQTQLPALRPCEEQFLEVKMGSVAPPKRCSKQIERACQYLNTHQHFMH